MSYIIAFAIAAGIGPGRASSATGINPSADSADVKATPPVIVNFQGHLRQGMNIVNGTYSMTFRLYDAAAGGNLLQTMGPYNVNVANGVFNVELPITQANILNYTNLWIEVEIPGLGGIYSPRVKINSAAFAYNAFMSDSTQRIRNKGVTPEDLMMSAANPNQANNFDLNANGRIDAALLDVPASGTDPGYIWNYQVTGIQQTNASFYIDLFGRAGNTSGKYGELNHASYGVYGQYNTSNYGYLGGNGYGGYGYGSSYGMYGRYSAASNYGYLGSASYGVYGYYNTGRYGYLGSASYGAYGYYDGSNYGYLGGSGTGAYGIGSTYGVRGAGGTYGVYGSGSTAGVYGSATTYGGWFYNNQETGSSGDAEAAVWGKSQHTYGTGGYFMGDNLSNFNYFIYGQGLIANGDSCGVSAWAWAQASNPPT
ncbi:MAG: hypothetical protein ABIN66_08070, partial [candidate division WOR-3 bacterium]